MSSRFSIALVSRSNAAGGGASRIAEELGKWLMLQEIDVAHFCVNPVGQLQPFQKNLHSSTAIRFERKARRVAHRVGLSDAFPTEYFTSLRQAVDPYDAVHFHDLKSAISPLSLNLVSRHRPVFFTAHDCSPFTGGCLYPNGCQRFRYRCGECPQLAETRICFDLTGALLKLNRWLARQKGIRYVFPSQWLHGIATSSVSFAEVPVVINNGFDGADYQFETREIARQELGIHPSEKVVIIAAHFLADPRKGLHFALTALRKQSASPLVIVVGIPPADSEHQFKGLRFWLTGYVSDRRKLGRLFAASDAFLFTSLEDNFPIMLQESLAAGTPVVGFGAGGVAEIVEHNKTGWLCSPGDQISLHQNLETALAGHDLVEMGRTARQSVADRFAMKAFGEAHLAIYREGIGG